MAVQSAAVSSRAQNLQKLAAGRLDDVPNTTFPAPQVLPGDSLDPENFEPEVAQSFQEWSDDQERNRVTRKRRTIYIHPPPKVCSGLKLVQKWKKPKLPAIHHVDGPAPPQMEDILRYVESFYWPLPVKLLQQLEFVDCASQDDATQATTRFQKQKRGARRKRDAQVGLLNYKTNSVTAIETRQKKGQLYMHQMSTNDLIDSLIEVLPDDAYAAVLLLEHDLFEDEDDEFIVGRAYGGSRVAVVSMARYNPCLDELQKIPVLHTWPLNCCLDFSRKEGSDQPDNMATQVSTTEPTPSEPVLAAIQHELLQGSKLDEESRYRTWLFRVCRAVSHELGHCFGIDHCIHFACVMQSSASLSEDARQPSYLCPMDFAKVLKATGAKDVEWLLNMSQACSVLGPQGGFGALGAWLSARAKNLAGELNATRKPSPT